MTENIDNEWKTEAPLLAGLQKPTVEMPDDSYFSSFHAQLKNKLEAANEWESENPQLAGLPKPVLLMPDNEYFNSLPEHVLSLASENQQWSLESATLACIEKPILDSPDEQYFQSLPNTIMSRIRNEEAPVVRLIPAIMRYAAIAACMAGTLFLYKGLIDSTPSMAISNHVYEADFENMPELYNSDELSVYLDNEKTVVAESNPEVEELSNSLDAHDELESLIEM